MSLTFLIEIASQHQTPGEKLARIQYLLGTVAGKPAGLDRLPSHRDLLDGDPSSWQAGMWSVVPRGGSVSPQ